MLAPAMTTMPAHHMLPASFPLGMAWFVVFASPAEMHWSKLPLGWDFPVVSRIEAEGYETFVPVERRTIIRNRKKREQIKPLLGSYVFVRFDREADDWGNILSVQGVHDILSNANDLPLRVPDLEIAKLRRLSEAGVFDFTKPRSAFREGDTVRIEDGPFAGLIAKVRSASPKKRIRLLLDGLGKLEIDPSQLVKV